MMDKASTHDPYPKLKSALPQNNQVAPATLRWPTPVDTLQKQPGFYPALVWQALHTKLMGQGWRQVPVILQMNTTECGAACLAMILSAHGRATRVTECRTWFGFGRNGVTAHDIMQAARNIGLQSKAYHVTDLIAFQQLPLPAIAHWNSNHFVVVERWTSLAVTLIDPAVGRRTVTKQAFTTTFSGVILTFTPGAEFKRRTASLWLPWQIYLQSFLQAPGASQLLTQILVASLVLQLCGLGFPFFTKLLIDQMLATHQLDRLPLLGLGMFALLLSQTLTNYLRGRLLAHLQLVVDRHLMFRFLSHIFQLPYRFFQERSSGDLLMRLSSNSLMREILTNQSVSIVLDGSIVVVYFTILCVQAPSFALLALLIGGIRTGVLITTLRAMQQLMQRDLGAQAETQSYLVEALSGIATLKAAGAEQTVLERWSSIFQIGLNISWERNRLLALVNVATSALDRLAPLAILWFGAHDVLNGSMSLGTLLMLNSLALVMLTQLSSLLDSGQKLQQAGAYLERIGDVLEAKPEQVDSEQTDTPILSGRICMKNISFRFEEHSPLVLKDISLTIEPGQKVALVGPTGSGKSTLAMLLLGLYEPTRGEICYDGIPLSEWSYRKLRRQCGVVTQDPFVFSGTLKENIAFYQPELGLQQIVEAAQLAGLHDEVEQMPMGYATRLAENGSGLSGGQRQRLALARALAHKPSILLLDEATSHLDVVTEAEIDQHLSSLSCTRIVIAHRLSTIYNADRIFVMDQGIIVEQGTHTELMALHGCYTKLVHAQLATTP